VAAAKHAGQKIACRVRLLRFSLEPHFSRSAAASRREEGATMINVNAFGVRPAVTAGNAGSHHAAHAAAAALAASHKRRAAAATDASVDRGST
jgi:hypothetical protein